jgi:hypothetical protein
VYVSTDRFIRLTDDKKEEVNTMIDLLMRFERPLLFESGVGPLGDKGWIACCYQNWMYGWVSCCKGT